MWFHAIWWVISQKTGASALGLQRVLGLGSYYTAWTWFHKVRRVMVRTGRDRISGVVEVDESYIGGEKSGKRGRAAAGNALVVIASHIDGTRIGLYEDKRTSYRPFFELCGRELWGSAVSQHNNKQGIVCIY